MPCKVIVNSIVACYGHVSAAETNSWISANGWKDEGDGCICVANQEDNIKTKNITEKITFDGKSRAVVCYLQCCSVKI